jgi:hypothetical protein
VVAAVELTLAETKVVAEAELEQCLLVLQQLAVVLLIL